MRQKNFSYSELYKIVLTLFENATRFLEVGKIFCLNFSLETVRSTSATICLFQKLFQTKQICCSHILN